MDRWLDNTRIFHWERCPRYFHWRHECGLVGLEEPHSAALNYGSAVHAGFEAAFKAMAAGLPLELAERHGWEAIETYFDEVGDPVGDWRTREVAVAAWSEWLRCTRDAISEWPEIVLVEHRVAVKVPDTDWVFLARVDLVVANATHLMIVDHKTTSRPIGPAVLTMTESPQLRTYAWAIEEALRDGRTINAAYNICASSRRRNRIGWGQLVVDHAFSPIGVTPALLAMHLQRIHHTIEAIESPQRPLRLSACSGSYGTRCEFWALCSNIGWREPTSADIEWALTVGFREEPWHPFERR